MAGVIHIALKNIKGYFDDVTQVGRGTTKCTSELTVLNKTVISSRGYFDDVTARTQ
jgi:hypothetical protein